MGLKRTTNKVPLDGTSTKVIVRYESDEAPAGTHLYREAQRRILYDLMENPGLLECGTQPFEKLRMYHNGFGWVVELEAISF